MADPVVGGLRRLSWVLIGLGLGLSGLGCGEEGTTTAAVDFPPQITQLVVPSQVSPNVPFAISHSLSVPGGLPATDTALLIRWSFPNGPTLVTQRFSAAQIGCLAGSISCTGQFTAQPPGELSVINTAYGVEFAVFDRQGRRGEQMRMIDLIAAQSPDSE